MNFSTLFMIMGVGSFGMAFVEYYLHGFAPNEMTILWLGIAIVPLLFGMLSARLEEDIKN